MALGQSLAPFRHRRFTLLWCGAFISNIGTWMETVGVGILVTSTTGKAGWTGLVAAAGFVPQAVLAPVAGALADRVSRRKLLLATTSAQTVFAGLLAFLTSIGTPSPGIVTLIVLGAGCASALGFPAYMAMLPDLVPTHELPGAIALSSAQWNLGRVVGPALAGLVIGFGGYELAFTINTLSFFAVLAVLASFTLPPPPHHGDVSIVESVREGARFVRGNPALRFVVESIAFNSLLAAPFIALIPAVALKVFHDGDFGTSLLVTAQGIGAVAMALSLAWYFSRFGARRTLLAFLGLLPIALLVYAIAPTLAFAAIAIVAVGYLYMGCLSSFTTIAQLVAPPELRGRVVSVLMMLLGALYPLGAVTQGAIADQIGLRATTAAAAVLLGLSFGLRMVLRPHRADALADVGTRDRAPSGSPEPLPEGS